MRAQHFPTEWAVGGSCCPAVMGIGREGDRGARG